MRQLLLHKFIQLHNIDVNSLVKQMLISKKRTCIISCAESIPKETVRKYKNCAQEDVYTDKQWRPVLFKWLSSYPPSNFQIKHFTFYQTSDNVLLEQHQWSLPTWPRSHGVTSTVGKQVVLHPPTTSGLGMADLLHNKNASTKTIWSFHWTVLSSHIQSERGNQSMLSLVPA